MYVISDRDRCTCTYVISDSDRGLYVISDRVRRSVCDI